VLESEFPPKPIPSLLNRINGPVAPIAARVRRPSVACVPRSSRSSRAGLPTKGSTNAKGQPIGLLLLDAKLADTATGVKSVLLRVLDPFFKRKGGGSSIPFKVTGDRRHPHYGLDRGNK